MLQCCMNLKRLFSNIKELQTVDDSVVNSLYTLSTRALLVVVLLAILIIVALYPILDGSILVWSLILMLLTGYRLYSAYSFKQNPKKYSMALWYKKFVVDAILTALVFSTLGFIFIHQVDHYYQLYIVAVLLGLSLGSTVSLSADARLNIMYSAET